MFNKCRVTAKEVEVLLGEHNYTTPDESDEIRVAVDDIIIHPKVRENIDVLHFLVNIAFFKV